MIPCHTILVLPRVSARRFAEILAAVMPRCNIALWHTEDGMAGEVSLKQTVRGLFAEEAGAVFATLVFLDVPESGGLREEIMRRVGRTRKEASWDGSRLPSPA